MANTTPPRWDLSNVYPGLDSGEFRSALDEARTRITDLEAFSAQLVHLDAQTDSATLARFTGDAIDRINETLTLTETIRAYLASFITTDSYNTTARRLLSEFEQELVRLEKLLTRFQAWVGKLAPVLPEMFRQDDRVRAHAFALQEAAEQSKYLMSEA